MLKDKFTYTILDESGKIKVKVTSLDKILDRASIIKSQVLRKSRCKS